MKDLKDRLREFFSGGPADFGIADISRVGAGAEAGAHPAAKEFPRAISILMPYRYDLSLEDYDEERFHDLLVDVRASMKDTVESLSGLLHSTNGGINHFIVPQGGQDPETLTAFFPHKFTAVRAGLGWIGKSSLLVTREHGPRVYLATVLIDSDIQQDGPPLEDGCGSCTACARVCPYSCINDVNWRTGTPREELLDIYLCNAKRERMIESKGRKDECGLCLLACTYGLR